MKTKTVCLVSRHRGRRFDLDVSAAPDFRFQPLIVFMHGFKGFKDWGVFPAMTEAFTNAGYAFCKFNFSHNGVTPENNTEFVDLDAFGENTLSAELSDLQTVLHYFTIGKSASEGILIDKNKVVLMGHSRGGGIAILGAAQATRHIKGLVTLSAVADFERHLYGDPELWEREGVLYVENARTGQSMPMRYSYYQDVMDNAEQLDVVAAAAQVQMPWLIVHGEADETVPLAEAKELSRANPQAKTFYLEGASHTFGARHPHNGVLPADFQRVVERINAFLKEEVGL